MAYSCKHQFRNFLRKEGIPYETCSAWVRIGNVFVTFRQDTVIFQYYGQSDIDFVTPLSNHITILHKYIKFKNMMENFIPKHLQQIPYGY